MESNLTSLLADVINWDKLKAFKQEDLKGGHYQPFWHLLQMAAISNLRNFTQEEVCNIHNEMTYFPSLKDDVERLDLLTMEKSKTDKYKEVIIDLLIKNEVEKESIKSKTKDRSRGFNILGYSISKHN